MQINFTGHHIDVTPSLKEFTGGKIERLLRHFDKIGSINVVFKVDKLLHIAEGTIHVAKNEFHAHAESEDLYSAIDALVDKLDRQIKKHKEKITDHRE